jgi:hypothetical protein
LSFDYWLFGINYLEKQQRQAHPGINGLSGASEVTGIATD